MILNIHRFCFLNMIKYREKGNTWRLQIGESIFRQQGANTSLKVFRKGVCCNYVTRVLLSGRYFPDSQNFTREYLQDYPFIQVDDIPIENVSDVIGDYDICVVRTFEMNSNVISRAKKMQLIMQFGVGLDGIDINAATKHGIKVAKIPNGNAASCAEMAIYLILALLRKQHQMEIAVKLKRLGEPIGDTLQGKTVLIMGFGNIGVYLAKRLRAFDVKIIATKRSWRGTNYNYDDLVDERGSHDDILKFASKADIVVCCLPMATETIGIVNNNFISAMKKGALLINIGRGGVLDYEAVYNNLKLGHLGGLGSDVAWTEPFDPLNPILQLPNVIITPHVAAVTKSSFKYTAKVVGDVALQFHTAGITMPFTGIEIVN